MNPCAHARVVGPLLCSMPDADEGLLEFVSYLLTVDPRKRPTAAQALQHPWLQVRPEAGGFIAPYALE